MGKARAETRTTGALSARIHSLVGWSDLPQVSLPVHSLAEAQSPFGYILRGLPFEFTAGNHNPRLFGELYDRAPQIHVFPGRACTKRRAKGFDSIATGDEPTSWLVA